jgi:hypothetical protein
MLTYSGQVCPTLISSGHTNEESRDATLHKVYALSHVFRGRDGASLHQLFIDSLLAHYNALFGSVNAYYNVPNDFYSAITYAIDCARENQTIELHSLELVYLFEFYICKKTRCPSNPYISQEWPRIQIP